MPLAHITPPPRHKQNEGATFDVSWCLAKSPHHDDTSRHGTTRREGEGGKAMGGRGGEAMGGRGGQTMGGEGELGKKNFIGEKRL